MTSPRLALATALILLVIRVTGAFASAPATGIAQEAPAWQQVNTNGFGDPQAIEVSALEAFNGHLYAGTANAIAGARIFRSQDGTSWTPVSQPGFGIGTDTRPLAIMDLAVFNQKLYASTGRSENAGQIWRSQDGATWAPMVIAGFGDPDSVDITALTEFDGYLYAGVTNRVSGAQVWRSASGDNNTWSQVAPATPGTAPATITGFAVYGAALHAAVESEGPAQIWRTSGGAWTTVVSDGFGSSTTTLTGGMAGFAGYLYVGAGDEVDGARLWRTNDVMNWEPAITPGFGDPNNQAIEAVFVFGNQLYASVKNATTGIELWRSTDGAAWAQVNVDGFGDGNNSGSNRSHAVAGHLGNLYVGTSNAVDGGEVWRMQGQQQRIYLPLILR